MKNIFATAAMCAAITLASCNSGGDANVTPETPDAQQPVSFTATVGNVDASPATRASGDTWATNDKIGVFMVGNGGTSVVDGVTNRELTTTAGDGAFATAEGSEIYYPTDGSKVDFIAYYPYDAAKSALDLPYSVTLGDQTNQAVFDLLWAKSDNSGAGYSKTSEGAVALNFKHVLSKLVMNVKAGDGVGESELDGHMTVTIKETHSGVRFNFGSGAFLQQLLPTDITAHFVGTSNGENNSTIYNYDAIVAPFNYTFSAVTVEFELTSGEKFVWAPGAIEFVSGKQHTYNVTLNRTGVSATGSITDWVAGTGGDVVAQ
ncbi:MAG: fimbrillin family protein [Alistipes sp.]|jgi:hypothetical protein|nr:fimbrillin family protein [Alistipes sp.]